MHSAATHGIGMIYLGMSPWNGMWKNRHHLMSRFAQAMPVVYVEPWQGFRKVRRALLTGTAGVHSTGRPGASDRRTSTSSKVRRSCLFPGVLPGPPDRAPMVLAHQALATNSVYVGQSCGYPVRRWRVQSVVSKSVCPYTTSWTNMAGTRTTGRTVAAGSGRRGRGCSTKSMCRSWSPGIAPRASRVPGGIYSSWRMRSISGHTMQRDIDPNVPEDLKSVPRPRLGYSGLIGKRLDLDLLHGWPVRDKTGRSSCWARSTHANARKNSRHCLH